MLQIPKLYKHHERSPLNNVYKTLRNKDLADCVVMAIKVLKETDDYLKFDKQEKSSSEAFQHFMVGRAAFDGVGDYHKALEEINVALMLAPVNSEVMQLLYCSRAELLLKTNQFQACVKDIEICLALSCSDSLVSKLREMKQVASVFIAQTADHQTSTPFLEQFFTLKGDSNPDIPCATSDVEVIMDSGKPKVIAAKDIPVGTVLAIETSFIRATHMLSNVTSCHYCLKMNFNLIPCEGCCSVMFCDKQCKQKAMQEGHNVECKIVNILLDDVKLPVKAMLKIRQLCSSWDEFITASKDLGTDRMKNSTIAEIFGSDKFSLLNSHYDTHFIYGAMLNKCMYFANIIHYLDTHTSFFPNSPDDKNAAIHAVSRVMMHLSLYCIPVQPRQVTSVCAQDETTLHNFPVAGYFPFLGNLAHSCLPNSYVVGLWNKAALVTFTPVKKGAELTFSYIGHWLEEDKASIPVELREARVRAVKLLIVFRMVCKDCVICVEPAVNSNRQPLTDTQRKAFSRYYSNVLYKRLHQNIEMVYKETCNTLQALSDVPFSKEYEKVYIYFVKCLMFCTQIKFPNVIMNSVSLGTVTQ